MSEARYKLMMRSKDGKRLLESNFNDGHQRAHTWPAVRDRWDRALVGACQVGMEQSEVRGADDPPGEWFPSAWGSSESWAEIRLRWDKAMSSPATLDPYFPLTYRVVEVAA